VPIGPVRATEHFDWVHSLSGRIHRHWGEGRDQDLLVPGLENSGMRMGGVEFGVSWPDMGSAGHLVLAEWRGPDHDWVHRADTKSIRVATGLSEGLWQKGVTGHGGKNIQKGRRHYLERIPEQATRYQYS
jgi:hypothetical protein